jgi:OOP family OmpA-OmpF porin
MSRGYSWHLLRGRRLSCVLGLVFLSFVDRAGAQEGFALNRFDPAEHGSVFFRGDSLDIAGHNLWTAGLVGDLAHKPLVVRDQDGNELANVIGDQLFLHTGATVVLFERLRFGLNLPLLVYQSASDFDAPGVRLSPEEGFSFGDLRLGADVRLLGESREAFRAALGMRLHLPTGRREAFASDGSLRVVPTLGVAGDIGPFVYAASTGVQIRTEGSDFGEEAVGSEIFLSASAGVGLLEHKLVLGPELFGSTVIADGDDGFLKRTSTPLELILGSHYDVSRDVRVGVGFGPGLSRGLGSPATRWLVSLAWVPAAKPVEPVPSDRDGDGVIDGQDRCPDVPGLPQSDPALHGCPAKEKPADRDVDGVPDDVDACPDQAGPEHREDPKKNGCPVPTDKDGDGIADNVDGCPTQPGPTNPDDPARHGCPAPLDTDGDGILDARDACPKEAGAANTDPGKNGCPLAIVRESRIEILDRIEFETGKATLMQASSAVLEAVVKVLQERPEITSLSVEGHTDNQGQAWFNRKLSRSRADVVVAWLANHGVAASRLTAAGFGADHPIDTNSTIAGRQTNRRVEFRVVQVNGVPSATSPEER